MSKHWKPPNVVSIRPGRRRGWTRLDSYWRAAPSRRRLPEGAVAGLVLVGAACVGAAIGLYQAFGPPVVFAPGSELRWSPGPPVIALPDVHADPADAEWERRALESRPAPAQADEPAGSPGRVDIHVIDGDTFAIGRQKVRIANIDAPETHPPRCMEEARLGLAATAKLRALLAEGPVTLSSPSSDHDQHGRLLRLVSVNGQDVGEAMMAAGLARAYGEGRRAWC